MPGFLRRRKVEFARAEGDYGEYVAAYNDALLADRLKITRAEVEAMPNDVYASWQAFFSLMAERDWHAERRGRR